MQAAKSPQSAFQSSIAKINKLIRDGGSLSGHERNCVFLNTTGPRFATISAVSGLDFDDDGRALGLSDWDHDGDIDVWVTNRTAPMVRFLRNDFPSGGHFLKLQLVGRSANRDAIGARVEVVLGEQSEQRLIKSLRCGEGFLGQSSKWLHFGLGTAATIDRVSIRWPDKTTSTLRGLKADTHYVVTQGEDEAKAWRPPTRAPLVVKPVAPPIASDVAQVLLTEPPPLPRLRYKTFDGALSDAIDVSGKVVLVNLWATWCSPCLKELRQFADEMERLDQAGVRVVAISVDGLGKSDTTAADAERILKSLGRTIAGGMADDALLERLQFIHDLPFASHRPIAIPASFLIDSTGRLAAVYRGPVEVARVLADVGRLSLPAKERREAALPFSGRWHSFPRPPGRLQIAIHLLERGEIEDANHFVRRHREWFIGDREFPKLAVWLGDEMIKKGEVRAGLDWFADALAIDPNHALALNNLAWQLAAHPMASVRNGRDAVRYAERAVKVTGGNDPTFLDTLAAAYAEAGRFEDAVRTAGRALSLATSAKQTTLIESLQRSVRRYERRQAQPNGEK
jgi:peroxiredoxin